MVLAMKTSGFGAGWTLLGRLWCACWRGAKGTSCSHLSWCTAWGRFLSHKFCKISGFGWIGTSFPNLSLKIRTDSCWFCLAVNHPGSSEAPLALPAALGGWFYGDKHHKTPSKLPRVSLRTPPNFLNTPQKVLNLRSWSDQANSWGQIEPRTLSKFGSQTKIIQKKSIYIFPSPKTTIKLNDS